MLPRYPPMLVLLLTLAGLLGGCGASAPTATPPHQPAPTITVVLKGMITEFQLSASNSQAGDITAGPDGNLWFTEAGAIGRMTPKGQISEFPLPSLSVSGDITSGSDNTLWFTETIPNPQSAAIVGKIGRITPAGQISEFPLPSSSNGGKITAGPDGALWFTEFGSNKIGRLT